MAEQDRRHPKLLAIEDKRHSLLHPVLVRNANPSDGMRANVKPAQRRHPPSGSRPHRSFRIPVVRADAAFRRLKRRLCRICLSFTVGGLVTLKTTLICVNATSLKRAHYRHARE
jgi:hypothetical protein